MEKYEKKLTIIVSDTDGSNSGADGESRESSNGGETDSETLFLFIKTV